MMYGKGSGMSARKGSGDRLLGALKGAARVAENPLVQFGVGLGAPEVGAVLALAKGSGLLKKISSS
jgi:hypothetical protein